MITNKRVVIGIGGLLCGVCLFAVPDAWRALGEISTRQSMANERLIEWKEAYQALLPVNERWKKAFISAAEVPDQLSLTRVVNVEQYGLKLDTDRVTQIGSEEVQVNGMPVGVQKLCIGTGSAGMEVSAKTMSELRTGMRGLASRKDLEMGTIEYAFSKGNASKPDAYVARISNFCVRVRAAEEVSQ